MSENVITRVMDDLGRIVIPKDIRKELGIDTLDLEKGVRFKIEIVEDGQVLLTRIEE